MTYLQCVLRLTLTFFLPFGGRLSENNRWVQLSYLVPWRRVEQEYSKNFSKDPRGGRAVSVRMALGALIIQEREGFSEIGRAHV